ncbi:MAG: Ig-like domain-containing protein [Verrucomicrobiota bacterium]
MKKELNKWRTSYSIQQLLTHVPCLVLVLSLNLIALPVQAQTISVKGELRRWHKITLELDGPSTTETASPNPFMDYRMLVIFTHTASGLSYTVPGYFAADGNAANTSATSGSKWHAHLSPDDVGQWVYEVRFRQGTDVAVASGVDAGNAVAKYNGLSGSFRIKETNKSGSDFRGRGRLNYVNKHYLQFAGSGKYFIKSGADSPENLLAYNDFDDTPNDPKINSNLRKSWAPHAQDYDATDASDYTWTDPNTGELQGTELLGALRYLSEMEGLNSFSFLTFNLDGDDDNVFPHLLRRDVAAYESIPDDPVEDAGGELPTTGRWANKKKGVYHDRFDVSKMAQWEKIMSYADKKGMFMDIKTQETENDRKMDGGDLGRERKLYYRELIARFGHHLGLQWNLGEENDLFRELDDPGQTRVKAYTQYFKDNDPYNHLVSIHSYPNKRSKDPVYKPLLGNQSELTGAALQTGKADFSDVFDDVKNWIDQSSKAERPWVVFCDEPGDASEALRPDVNPGNSHENGRKNVIWGSIMAGGAGANFYFGYEYEESDLTCQDWRSRDNFWDYCRYMLQFFENYDIPLQDMSNDNSLTSHSKSWCLAKTGDTYLIYLKNGGSTSINLSDVNGTYNVNWYDPRNGGALQQTSTAQVNGGGNRNLGRAPNSTNQDWVILIQNSAISTNNLPSVAFSEASSLTLDEGYTNIFIEAEASDSDGIITNVQLYLDGDLIRVDRKSKYRWNQNNSPGLLELAAGSYVLTLIAEDDDQATSIATATLTVMGSAGNMPPTVDFNKNSTLMLTKGYSEILIRANASDSDGSVDYVQLYINQNFVGEDNTGPYKWTQNTNPEWLLGLAAGTYDLTLVVGDDQGSTAQEVATLTVESEQGGASEPILYEAEGPEVTTSEPLLNNATGFSGTGFIDFYGKGFIEWTVLASENLAADIRWRYSLRSGNRPLRVLVNSLEVSPSLDFPATGSRSTWSETPALAVNLLSGSNTIRIEDTGSSGPNIDYLRVLTLGEPIDLPNDLTMTLEDDVFTEDGQAINDNSIRLENSSRARVAYLKFNIGGLTGPPASAILQLEIIDSGNGTIRAFLGEDTSWSEENLGGLKSSPPLAVSEITSINGPYIMGNILALDVTNAISGNGDVTLILTQDPTSSSNDVGFASKEGSSSGVQAPKLVIIQ